MKININRKQDKISTQTEIINQIKSELEESPILVSGKYYQVSTSDLSRMGDISTFWTDLGISDIEWKTADNTYVSYNRASFLLLIKTLKKEKILRSLRLFTELQQVKASLPLLDDDPKLKIGGWIDI